MTYYLIYYLINIINIYEDWKELYCALIKYAGDLKLCRGKRYGT